MTTKTVTRQMQIEMTRRYPDTTLLFLVGDHYETFDRATRVPAARIDAHVAKLVASGQRVGICEAAPNA